LSDAILKPSATPVIKADAYFFDIDGTLMVSRDLVHWHAMHQAMLEVYGLDANFDGIPYHGKTDVAILRMALTRRGISEATFAHKLAAALGVVRREVSANVAGLKPAPSSDPATRQVAWSRLRESGERWLAKAYGSRDSPFLHLWKLRR